MSRWLENTRSRVRGERHTLTSGPDSTAVSGRVDGPDVEASASPGGKITWLLPEASTYATVAPQSWGEQVFWETPNPGRPSKSPVKSESTNPNSGAIDPDVPINGQQAQTESPKPMRMREVTELQTVERPSPSDVQGVTNHSFHAPASGRTDQGEPFVTPDGLAAEGPVVPVKQPARLSSREAREVRARPPLEPEALRRHGVDSRPSVVEAVTGSPEPSDQADPDRRARGEQRHVRPPSPPPSREHLSPPVASLKKTERPVEPRPPAFKVDKLVVEVLESAPARPETLSRARRKPANRRSRIAGMGPLNTRFGWGG